MSFTAQNRDHGYEFDARRRFPRICILCVGGDLATGQSHSQGVLPNVYKNYQKDEKLEVLGGTGLLKHLAHKSRNNIVRALNQAVRHAFASCKDHYVKTEC